MIQEPDRQAPRDQLIRENDYLRREIARLKSVAESCGVAENNRNMLDRLIGMLDILSDGILVLDKDSNVQYANPVMKFIIQQDLVGKNIYDVYPGNSGSNFLKTLTRSISEQKTASILEYAPKVRSWYYIKVQPFTDFTVAIFYDRSSYERLSDLYKLTHYTMDNVQEYAIWCNMDGSIAYVNNFVRTSMGYGGKSLFEYKISGIILDFPVQSWDELQSLIKKGRSITFESPIRNVYDKTFPGEVTANFVRFKHKTYIVFFIRDITERKKHMDEINSAKAQSELYLDLMCHDINNMNQIGIGFLELAMDSDDVGEASRELLAKTMEAFGKSTLLINNVKKLQSARSNSLQMRPVDLASIVEGVVKQSTGAGGRDVNVDFECRSGCKVVANDLIKDVFENLIGNAIKHSTGKLSVGVIVDTTVFEGRSYCRTTISDNGPGIPDSIKEKIFNRIDVDKHRATGKGLGLYLVKTLVEDFHGRVWAEDRVPGDYRQGAKFVVLLPEAKE
jgi:PAS domain S-box-containing protein